MSTVVLIRQFQIMISTVASNLMTSHLKEYSESLKRRLCHVYIRQFSFSFILLSHCATRREVPASVPGRVLGNFQVTYSFCAHSVALGSTRRLAEMSTKEFA